jgi:hypothetical protein
MCSEDSEFGWPAMIQSSTMDLQLWRIADPILQSIYMFLTVACFNRWGQVSTTTKGECIWSLAFKLSASIWFS